MQHEKDDDKVVSSDEFLRKRGLSPDGAVYVRMLLAMMQELRLAGKHLKSHEIQESIEDLFEYMDNEITFIRHAEAYDLENK
jgi:hypothetical protein